MLDRIQQAINRVSPIQKLEIKEFLVNKENLAPTKQQTPSFAKQAVVVPKRSDSKQLVDLKWVTIGDAHNDSIYGSQISLNTSEFLKHFQKAKAVRKPLAAVSANELKFDGIFDNQRSITIQTSLVRLSFDKNFV